MRLSDLSPKASTKERSCLSVSNVHVDAAMRWRKSLLFTGADAIGAAMVASRRHHTVVVLVVPPLIRHSGDHVASFSARGCLGSSLILFACCLRKPC